MKLRNKKTGKIGELSGVNRIIVYEPLDVSSCGNSILGEYDTLAELIEEWEDYKPAEMPRIMNRKSRNTIRAWAEINGFDKVTYEYDVRFAIASFVVGHATIRFFDCFSLLENGKEYTIAELCGEDKECES